LRQAGLIAVRRESRSMIYTAQFDTMNGLVDFLTENCLQRRRRRVRSILRGASFNVVAIKDKE